MHWRLSPVDAKLIDMSAIHLAQVGFFKPVLEALLASGANVDQLLRRSGLHRFNLDNENAYVPQQAMQSLFELIKAREGIDAFLPAFANSLHVAQLANWGNTLSNKSNLLSAVKFAVRYGHIVLTNERITLRVEGRKATVSLLFDDAPKSYWSQFEELNFAYMYSTFRLAAGANTAPDEIHLQALRAPDLDVLLPPGNNTRVLLGQPATALVFPAELLASPMLGLSAMSQPDPDFPQQPPGTADAITAVFDAWSDQSRLNLDLVCDALDMSPRSLQRRISEEGKTFREIVDQWRLTKSMELLADPRLTIAEISQRLGYANPPNLDRAFRRWTGLTPTQYRDRG